MNTLKTTYLGIPLKNPFIISSSNLTNSLSKNIELEKAGAGAIVLNSLFEEQILSETDLLLRYGEHSPEAIDYIQHFIQSHNLSDYLELIKDCKQNCTIPIIASINCFDNGKWIEFAHQIENAGADALELNIFNVHTNKYAESTTLENEYAELIHKICSSIKIPVSVKIGKQYTNIVHIVQKIAAAGAKGIVLFNRHYQLDINIDTIDIKRGKMYSHPNDFADTLRWTAIVSGCVQHIDVASCTGIHNWKNTVKALLAGAQTIEICSAIAKYGTEVIEDMEKNTILWMKEHGYKNISEYRAKLNYNNIDNPSLFERSQFLRFFCEEQKNKNDMYL